jgi:amidase
MTVAVGGDGLGGDAEVHIVGTEHSVFCYDARHDPVLTVDPGAQVRFDTLDARCGRMKSPADVYSSAPDFSKPFPEVDPATGPVAVRGARPGDTLRVIIKDITLGQQGFVIVKPEFGVLRGAVTEPVGKVVAVQDGKIRFSDQLNLPTHPMIGEISTAPAGDAIASAYVHHCGGNMDNNRITIGACVYLPVEVAGGLLYVGDIHAAMGDGEACGLGLEISGGVLVQIELLKDVRTEYPVVEDQEIVATNGIGLDFYEAAEIAVGQMVRRLSTALSISTIEAYMLVSCYGHMRLNQASRCLPIKLGVRVEIPRGPFGL